MGKNKFSINIVETTGRKFKTRKKTQSQTIHNNIRTN